MVLPSNMVVTWEIPDEDNWETMDYDIFGDDLLLFYSRYDHCVYTYAHTHTHIHISLSLYIYIYTFIHTHMIAITVMIPATDMVILLDLTTPAGSCIF